jgi:hypothetical protein
MNETPVSILNDCQDVLYEISQHQLLIESATQKLDWMFSDCSDKVRAELSDIAYFLTSYRDVEVRIKLATVIDKIDKAQKQSIQGRLESLFNE